MTNKPIVFVRPKRHEVDIRESIYHGYPLDEDGCFSTLVEYSLYINSDCCGLAMPNRYCLVASLSVAAAIENVANVRRRTDAVERVFSLDDNAVKLLTKKHRNNFGESDASLHKYLLREDLLNTTGTEQWVELLVERSVRRGADVNRILNPFHGDIGVDVSYRRPHVEQHGIVCDDGFFFSSEAFRVARDYLPEEHFDFLPID